MDYSNSCVLRLFCFSVLLSFGLCTRTSTLIYYDVIANSTGMCFRRFNATHQIGCSSGRSGSVGVVYYAANESVVQHLITDGSDAPYILLMQTELFNTLAHQLIDATRAVSGIVVMPTNDTNYPDNFSPDSECPDDRYGAYSEHGSCRKKWNPHGNNLMFANFPFPVTALLNHTVADFLLNECFEKHNAPGPDGQPRSSLRCGMEIKDAMNGAKDTPTCMRRSNLVMNLSPQGYCDPLGNSNIFSFLRPVQREENKSVIIVAARYDSFSMFDGQYPGVDSAALSFVTVFAVAEALGRVKHMLGGVDKHIMLVLFHGEAFDYIGSSRMVYDLEKGRMNFTLDDIDTFVEIGQIGLHGGGSDENTVWIHSGINTTEETSEVRKLIEKVGVEVGLKLSEVGQKQPLPPASFQSFLKARNNIPGVVLTNHENEFTNRFYNSMFDTVKQSGLDYPSSLNDSEKYSYVGNLAIHLQKISTVVARTVYQLATGNNASEDCSSKNVTVANLIYCLTVNPDCELLNSSYASRTASALRNTHKFLSRYVGVSGSQSNYDILNVNLFARFLGDVVDNVTEKQCDQMLKDHVGGYNYFYMQGPINESDPLQTRTPLCMRSATNHSDAVSPAFDIKDYDYSSHKYSAWTESRWETDALSVRIFLMPSLTQQLVTFIIGFIMMVVSFVVVYAIEKKASILFTPLSGT